MSILLKNVSYIDVKNECVIDNSNIYIEDNKVSKVDKDIKIDADDAINCENKLAIPALINAHTHLGMTMMRNYADDLDLNSWLNDKIFPLEAKLTGEDIYYASLLSIIENIRSGVSTVCDMYDAMHRVADGVIESGIRGIITKGLTDITGDPEKKIDDTIRLYKDYHNKANERIKVMPSPHAIYTCSTEFIKEIIDISKSFDSVLNMHISETKKEIYDCIAKHEKRPIEYLDDLGLFDLRVIAAHCTHLNEEEIDFISEKEFYPVYNPTSNLKLASGFTDIKYMLEKNVCVTLGTDGSSSNNNQDMFEEMHIGAIVNKALKEDPKAVKAIDMLKMATINGAEAFNINIGEIKEGKLADIALINLNSLNFVPKNNLISAICYSANSKDVSDLIVDGKFIMRNKEILTLDEEKIKNKVRELTKDLLNR
ncbi:ATZ_TRZ_like [Peptoniphilus sp. ING2-D1G]|nr:ATZ_TRZ_like [Peptoniphilus sp. ING2-D1G]